MKMTKKQALDILIRNAAANCAGVGCGIRPTITEKQHDELFDAINKIHVDAYGRPLDGNDVFNLNLQSRKADGLFKKHDTSCSRCDGTGEICDVCGESDAACQCDPDDHPTRSECSDCGGTGK